MSFAKSRPLPPLLAVLLASFLAACQAPPASSVATNATAPGETCIRPDQRNYLYGTWSGRWQEAQGGDGSTMEITLLKSGASREWSAFDVHVKQHLPYGDYDGTIVEYDTGAYIRDCKLIIISSKDETRWWWFGLRIDPSDATKASLYSETTFGESRDRPGTITLDYTSFGSKFIWPE